MESCRVAFEWRSRCQFTLPNPRAFAAGLSCRDSNVRRSSTVPFPLGKTRAAGSYGNLARFAAKIPSPSVPSGIRRTLCLLFGASKGPS